MSQKVLLRMREGVGEAIRGGQGWDKGLTMSLYSVQLPSLGKWPKLAFRGAMMTSCCGWRKRFKWSGQKVSKTGVTDLGRLGGETLGDLDLGASLVSAIEQTHM